MPKWTNFLKSFKWRLTPKKMASSKEILFPLKMVASIPLNVVSVMKHDQRKRDSGSSEMPTPLSSSPPPFYPLDFNGINLQVTLSLVTHSKALLLNSF